MSSGHFPGKGGLPVDERIVAPESRAEIIEGRLVFSPPAEEKHAVPHADLAYVLRAHVRAGFNVAVDMLTRSGLENDFAPDASVYEAERDTETGGRRLEQLAFEIVNEQALATQTTKARALTARGVRRVFVLVVKHRKLLEWSRETDAWAATPLEAIDDPVFVRPVRASALASALAADEAVLRALKSKGHPVLDEIREEGRQDGLEQGLEQGLRLAILDLCEALEIRVTDEQRGMLASARRAELERLRGALKNDRRWSDGEPPTT